MLVFEERGKSEYLRQNLSEQSREPIFSNLDLIQSILVCNVDDEHSQSTYKCSVIVLMNKVIQSWITSCSMLSLKLIRVIK